MKRIFICPRRHRLGEAGESIQELAFASSPLEYSKPGGAKATRLAFGLGLLSPSLASANRSFGATASPSRRFGSVIPSCFAFACTRGQNRTSAVSSGADIVEAFGLVQNLFSKGFVFLFSFLPPVPLPFFSLSEPLTKTRQDGGEHSIRGGDEGK